MALFDKIDCIIGDSFFFKAAEQNVENILKKQYNLNKITKEFVFSDSGAEKLNAALLPNIFDIEPKIVILRDIKNKLIAPAINSLKNTFNVFLIIEIEEEQYDKRVKIFKELEKNNCLHVIGFASCNKKDKVLELAFNKIEELLDCKLNKETKQFFADYIPKIEYKNKPIHNLKRIYNEIKKVKHIDNNIPLEICKKMISSPQKYYSSFDITQAFFESNIELALNILDNNITDINAARQILALIMSEIKIICSVQDKSNLPFNEIYELIKSGSKKYDILDNDDIKVIEAKPLHPYRLQKILEKRNSSYFNNCYDNLKLCIKAHNDLNYYQNNYKIPLIQLFLKLCS